TSASRAGGGAGRPWVFGAGGCGAGVRAPGRPGCWPATTVERTNAIAKVILDRISLFYSANWYTASVTVFDTMDHTASAPSSGTPLGVSGYTFADLHQSERLSSLYDRFCEEVQVADPALWREWDRYRHAPDEPLPPVELSNLLIAMAGHVSR